MECANKVQAERVVRDGFGKVKYAYVIGVGTYYWNGGQSYWQGW